MSGSQDSADEANSARLHALLGTKRNYSYTRFFLFTIQLAVLFFHRLTFTSCVETALLYFKSVLFHLLVLQLLTIPTLSLSLYN